MPLQLITPWATAKRYIDAMGRPQWVSPEDGERIAAYNVFESMYSNVPETFNVAIRSDDDNPIYLPCPKTVVDTTAHYFLKGLEIKGKKGKLTDALEPFLVREKFYSKFHTAKHSGVVRGDFMLHISVNPLKPEGSRLSINSLDPAMYFPLYHEDDIDRVIGVRLVEQVAHPDDASKTVVRILDYWYEGNLDDPEQRSVATEENLWEMEGWNNEEKRKLIRRVQPPVLLPEPINTIPVYHFKNIDWQGEPFGRSELHGFERIFAALNQGISDEELTLALMGIGCYATDAARPVDSQGNETDWAIVPGSVLEVPGATMFKKLEGVSSVTPMLDHLRFIQENLYESSGTSDIARGRIDVQVAESGIALAIRFMPTAAKLEQRDLAGVEVLQQMWYDWLRWYTAYEPTDLTGEEVVVTLGEKLPVNRAKIIDELNNLMDRRVISRKYFRQVLEEKLGYIFPSSIEQEILDEERELQEARTAALNTDKSVETQGNSTLPPSNTSNNAEGSNESKGTEIAPEDAAQ